MMIITADRHESGAGMDIVVSIVLTDCEELKQWFSIALSIDDANLLGREGCEVDQWKIKCRGCSYILQLYCPTRAKRKGIRPFVDNPNKTLIHSTTQHGGNLICGRLQLMEP